MTNIIAFRAQPRTPRPSPDRSANAQILFFTGVRYVRDEEDQPEAQIRSPHRQAKAVEVDRDERLKA